MKKWLSKIGLGLLRFIVIYIVLYLIAILVINPEIPRSSISFFCWLASLVFADHEEIKDRLDKNGKV